jgi:hypothetical protein
MYLFIRTKKSKRSHACWHYDRLVGLITALLSMLRLYLTIIVIIILHKWGVPFTEVEGRVPDVERVRVW